MTKRDLQDLISKLKTKQFREGEAKGLVETIGDEIKTQLTPAFKELGEGLKEEMSRSFDSAVKSIRVDTPEITLPEINVPEVVIPPFPEIKIPAPQVTVKPADVNVEIPEFPKEMEVFGGVEVINDTNSPVPVRWVNVKGEDVQIPIMGSAGGTVGLTDAQLRASPVEITGNLSATTTPFATYYASDAVGSMNVIQLGGNDIALNQGVANAGTIRTVQASDVIASVAVKEIFGSTITSLLNGDNRIPVSVETGGSGLTDTELRASAVPVAQVSGASWSTSASIVSVSDIFSTTATSNVVNSDNRVKVELPATSVTVTSITNSTATSIVDSGGVQYSGSNPIPVTVASQPTTFDVKQVSGSIDSVFVTGAADSFFAFEVMTTNKTAKSDGADIRPKADDLGRQVMRPIQVRDLIATAYVSVSNGTETTLLAAGGAGVYHDLIMITATNNSTAATQLDIRATTGGNIIHTMYLPASTGPVGFSPSVPWPQDNVNNNWTIDMPDQTGTTVHVSALFSKEI